LFKLLQLQVQLKMSSASPTPPPKAQALKGVFVYFKPLSCHAFENTESGTSNLNFEDKICEVENIRGREGGFRLDGNGFCWVKYQSKFRVGELGREMIEERYLGEVESLVRDLLGVGEGDGDGGGEGIGMKRVVRVFDWKVSESLLFYYLTYRISIDSMCS
jgi:hypothetical protein